MPAAELSRLRAQIQAIATQFVRPKVFVRSLINLMEMYSDGNIQAGSLVKPKILMPSYRLPEVVIQQLELQLINLVNKHPTIAMEVIDDLWQNTYFEPHYLVVVMLGNLPSDSAEFIQSRLERWVNPREEKRVIQSLLKTGSQRIRHEAFHEWLTLIKSWLNNPDADFQQIGLKAMKVSIDDPHIEELPLFYELLEPFILKVSLSIQRDLLRIFSSIAHQSPKESIFFLKAIIEKSDSTEVRKFVRRCLPFFDNELQNSLLKYL